MKDLIEVNEETYEMIRLGEKRRCFERGDTIVITMVANCNCSVELPKQFLTISNELIIG